MLARSCFVDDDVSDAYYSSLKEVLNEYEIETCPRADRSGLCRDRVCAKTRCGRRRCRRQRTGQGRGRAAAEISAQVVAIDKATRTVTLKGPQGNVVDVVAGDEVKNFAQIKVGDFVVVRYAEALTLELRKTKAGPAT